MSRGAYTFRQGDVTRAVRAVRAAGIEVRRVEVDRAGKIVVVTGEPGKDEPIPKEGNEWDRI
jgi:hypothetical protein